MSSDNHFSVEYAIRRWVCEPCNTSEDEGLVVQLREVVIDIVRGHLDTNPQFQAPQHFEKEDLAIEFLLFLRAKGKWMIRTKSGLKSEYRSWVTAFCSPAQHELWEILSAALHDLARRNVAWRLDAPADSDNHNNATWTGIEGDSGRKASDLVAFGKAARLIPNYPPPAARKWHDDGTAVPKVIAPKDAQLLTLSLLQAAGGAIDFRDLLEEFKRHVFAFDLAAVVADATDKERAPVSIHPATVLRLYDLAHERAALIWSEVSQVEGVNIKGTQLLCDYFIPKNLNGQSVALERFGDPRRVHEIVGQVVKILREHLALSATKALDADAGSELAVHRNFVQETMQIICDKCGCRYGKTLD